VTKTPEQLYKERAKRVEDAVQLKIPDRVPIVIPFGFFPAKYTGITCEDAFYNPAKWKAAVIKTAVDFAPDICAAGGAQSGGALEALDFKQMRWPGHGVSPHHSFQFVEGEYMKADEYDAFLEDPTGFILKTHLPRVCGNLEPLQNLPSLIFTLFSPTMPLGMPGLEAVLESISKARQEVLKYNEEMGSLQADLAELGFPPFGRAGTFAPFDTIADRLRGLRGAILDMYRQPENLIKACERVLPLLLDIGISAAKRTGSTKVFMPLHKGAEGFMSPKQYETFYWPTFKRLLLGLIDAGLTPCPFFEGDYTSRLEYLRELPRGKVVGHFDTSDIVKTKEILGNHMCIQGNVPPSLLQTGTPQDVRDYCKKLIDVVGKGGGFIMSPRSSIDEVKPENLKAMSDFTKEYGVYK
jgi:hypothetical protein